LQSGLCNCKPKFSLPGPRGLQGPASQGPHRPLHEWPPVKSAAEQNVSILDVIGGTVVGGGADNCSYKTCKAPVKSSSPTNQHRTFYRPDAFPLAQPTVSKHSRK